MKNNETVKISKEGKDLIHFVVRDNFKSKDRDGLTANLQFSTKRYSLRTSQMVEGDFINLFSFPNMPLVKGNNAQLLAIEQKGSCFPKKTALLVQHFLKSKVIFDNHNYPSLINQ